MRNQSGIRLRVFFVIIFGGTILLIALALLSVRWHQAAMRDLVRERNEQLAAVLANTLAANGRDTSTLPPEINLFIIDQAGQVLFQQGDLHGRPTLANHAGVAPALAGQTGSTFADAGIDEHVISYAPLGDAALIIEEEMEVIMGDMRLNSTLVAPLTLIPMMLLALAALWFGARQIVSPLQELSQQAVSVGRGNFNAVDQSIDGIAEIQQLHGELQKMAHEMAQAQASLRDYAHAVTSGQETERRRLARELHDDTIQSLLVLNQRIELARFKSQDESVMATLDEMQQLLNEQIVNTRRIIHALQPTYLEELGLATALAMLAQEQGADFVVQGDEVRLDDAAELALFRIAQEAVRNSQQHAAATNIQIVLSFVGQAATLIIQDDGIGFDVPDDPTYFAQKQHYGLLNIRERAQSIGATVAIESELSHGTRVVVALA